LARGVALAFSEGDLMTRSSSCKSEEREVFEGVGGRESCDETDLAELVAVVGAEGNEGWDLAISSKCWVCDSSSFNLDISSDKQRFWSSAEVYCSDKRVFSSLRIVDSSSDSMVVC
jgi:hypothetical protein